MTDETALAPEPADEVIDLNAEQTAQNEIPKTPEAPTTQDDATPEPTTTDELASDETTPEDTGDPKKNVPGSQKLKRRLQLIESDYEATARENAELRRRLESLAAPNERGFSNPGDRAPTEADFPNDYFAYQDARMAWNSRQAIREELARVEQAKQHTQADRQRREMLVERQEAYEETAALARDRIEDFDKVIRSATDVKITNEELVDEILSSDKAALIHYYLAKNPEKARELNGMRGKELAREVGRLEARVHLPQAKKTTGAPPPPSSPKGGASTPYDPYTSDDMEAHVRWWNEQQKKRA